MDPDQTAPTEASYSLVDHKNIHFAIIRSKGKYCEFSV